MFILNLNKMTTTGIKNHFQLEKIWVYVFLIINYHKNVNLVEERKNLTPKQNLTFCLQFGFLFVYLYNKTNVHKRQIISKLES